MSPCHDIFGLTSVKEVCTVNARLLHLVIIVFDRKFKTASEWDNGGHAAPERQHQIQNGEGGYRLFPRSGAQE